MKPAQIISVAALLGVTWLFAQTPAPNSAPNSKSDTRAAGGRGASGTAFNSTPTPLFYDDSPLAGDPPARVARLNWLSGDVSFQPAGIEDWTAATLNYPLTTADHLFTAEDSRAELHIGPNAIRLGPNSNFGFLNLDDSIVQVSLTDGSMEIHLTRLDDNDAFEIATPDGAITLLRTGDYRIDTGADRDTTLLTVTSGQAELFSGRQSTIIRAQQNASFRDNQDADVRTATPGDAIDAFDAFVSAREGKTPETAPSDDAAYMPPPAVIGKPVLSATSPVSDEVTGAEDLTKYGSWQSVSGYGDVWVPPVDPNWAPYSDGSWSYIEPYGWTWTDTAVWGFAPFHYGRWAYVLNHWVWIPGGKGNPVIYYPAVVNFYGGGATGIVSWVPIGPRESWIPPWHSAPAVIPNSPALKRGFPLVTDHEAPGAIRTMSQMDFTAGRSVHTGVALSPEGQNLGSSPQLAPVRESVLPGQARTHRQVAYRNLVARTAPPPPPVLFSAKQNLLAQTHGRPLPAAQLAEIRKNASYAIAQAPLVRSSKPLVSGPRPAPPPAKASARPARQGQ